MGALIPGAMGALAGWSVTGHYLKRGKPGWLAVIYAEIWACGILALCDVIERLP